VKIISFLLYVSGFSFLYVVDWRIGFGVCLIQLAMNALEIAHLPNK